MSTLNLSRTARGGFEDRAEVKEVAQRKKELRESLRSAQSQVDEARLAFADGRVEARELAEASNHRDSVKMQLDDAEQGHAALLGRLAPGGRTGGGYDFDPTASISEQMQDPSWQEGMRRMSATSSQLPMTTVAEIPRDAIARIAGRATHDGLSFQATATGGVVTPTPGMGAGPYGGIHLYPTPPTTLLDLLPVNTYDHATLPFSQEISETGDPGPAPQVPGATKSAAGIGYVDATTASTTVAGWTKINKQNLADLDQLQAAITTRLLQKLRAKLEALCLTADGTVSDATGVTGIKGLLETTGINTTDGTGIGVPEAILAGIVAVIASGGTPSAIVLNLNDWARLLSTKASGSGEYVANPFLAQVRTLYDVAFLPSVAVASGTAIVLDTRLACTLLFREGASVIIGQESDDMLKNRVTLLCETRVLLPVWTPAAICEVENLGVSG
jgi:hypothetical protein